MTEALSVTLHALLTTVADVIAIAYAAGASEALGPEALAAGAAAGGVAGAAAAGAGANSDKGFRYATGDGTVYDEPSSNGTPTARAPRDSRMPYDRVARDSDGKPTHYHVQVPGSNPGWIPADQTSDERPASKPVPRPSVLIEGADAATVATHQGGASG